MAHKIRKGALITTRKRNEKLNYTKILVIEQKEFVHPALAEPNIECRGLQWGKYWLFYDE